MKKTFKPSNDQFVDLFFTFLKQNKAYDAYMHSFFDPDLFHCFDDFNCVAVDVYISNAFCWASTPEGLNYWKLLDYKWRLVIDLFNL